ncbi:hypothetical protein HDE_06742 [Halotydeus destructor]|nr:hypothetical protein HDE_06742 [Halotydeus destructor]
MSRASGGGSWEELAATIKAKRSTPATSDAGGDDDRKSFNTEYSSVNMENLDTSDTRAFPPPRVDDESIRRKRRDRRDEVTGWTFRGAREDGSGGVNVLRGESKIIDLAVEGKTTLEAQLKMQPKPVIGLDEVVEYIDPDADSAPRVYYCSMCAIMRSVATIMEHILSFNHRVRAIRKRFPNEVRSYLMPDGKTINRNHALMMIATKRASEIELVYGRGDVQVRHERPSYPEEYMDAEESFQLVMTSAKSLDNLKRAHEFFKSYKIESQEEFRLLKAIMDLCQDHLIEWRVNQNTTA